MIFLLCFVAAAVWTRMRASSRTDAAANRPPLLDCRGMRVSSLLITRRNSTSEPETLAFERIDTAAPGLSEDAASLNAVWSFSPPNKAARGEADAGLLMRLSNALCDLYEYGTEQTQDLSLHGLDAPPVEVTVQGKSAEGEDLTFKLRYSAKNSGRMALMAVERSGVWAVYTVPAKIRALYALPADAYWNRRVMRMLLDNIQLARLNLGGRDVFTLERNGADWHVVVNGADKGVSESEGERYVNRIGTLRALEILKHDFPPAECAGPRFAAAVSLEGVGGRKEVLRFSRQQRLAEARGARLLACSSERRTLFSVHADMWKYLDKRAADFLVPAAQPAR